MKMAAEICVLTLNCWGIPIISKQRVARMTAIGEELATGKYDFVFLQEVWANEDYLRLCYKTQKVLPHSHYFYSGVIGAGVCIFSKAPIEDVFFHKWVLNGYIHKVHHGDWLGGKGIGLCRVFYRGLFLNLYVAHLHAEYDKKRDQYLAHRVTQSFNSAQFIRLTGEHADVTILGGDLNTTPDDIAYRVIRHNAQLQDAFLNADRPQDDVGATYFTPGNSYTPEHILRENPHGERLDYIMYRAGKGIQVDVLTCEVPLPNHIPDETFSYSDHEAVVTRFRIVKSANVTAPDHSYTAQAHSLVECIDICETALKKLENDRRFYYLVSMMCLMMISSTLYLDIPYIAHIFLAVGNIVLTVILCYSSFMSLIWYKLEKHGILAGKLEMDVAFKCLLLQEPSIAKIKVSEMYVPKKFGEYMPVNLVE